MTPQLEPRDASELTLSGFEESLDGSLDASAALVSECLEQEWPSEWSTNQDVSEASPMPLSPSGSQSIDPHAKHPNPTLGNRLVDDWPARLAAMVKGFQPL